MWEVPPESARFEVQGVGYDERAITCDYVSKVVLSWEIDGCKIMGLL